MTVVASALELDYDSNTRKRICPNSADCKEHFQLGAALRPGDGGR